MKKVLLLFMLFSCSMVNAQVNYYVDDNTGSEFNSGSGWESPLQTLDQALDKIGYETNNGQTYNIHIKEGLYTRPTSTGSYDFEGDKIINFIGGYPQDAINNCFRDPATHLTQFYYTKINSMFRILSETDLNFDGIYYNDPELAGGAADATFLDFKNGENSHNSIKNSMICAYNSVTPGFVHYRNVANSSLSIDNVYVSSGLSSGSNGGFMYTWGGTNVDVNVSNSTFAENSPGGSWGAIFRTNERTFNNNDNLNINVVNSKFINNSKDSQSPVFNLVKTNLTITGSEFLNNKGNEGGVIYVHDKGSTGRDLTSNIVIDDSKFKNNSNGVIYNEDNDGSTRITNSMFQGNTSNNIAGSFTEFGNDYSTSFDITYEQSCTIDAKIYTCVGTISGSVFEDTNNDGNPDAPIQGVVIKLIDSDNNVYVTATTDENGLYQFLDVPEGDYTIMQVQPAGYSDVKDGDTTPEDANDGTINNDNMISVTVGVDEDDNNNDFLEEKFAKLSGNVSEDTNNDDEGEVMIVGVEITLTNATTGETQTTTTDENGNYTFDNLVPGDYIVNEAQPAGYISVRDGDDTPDGDTAENANTSDDEIAVSLVGGEHDTDNDFVEEKTATISGNVSEDTTGDGNGDSPLSGVTITLVDENGDVVEGANGNPLTTTDSNGDYTFDNVPAGDYFVVETDPNSVTSVKDGDTTDGSDDTTNADTNDNSIPVSVKPGETDSGNDFVDAQPAKILGSVTLDTDGDDNGDSPLSGVTVTLVDTNGDVVVDTDGNPLTTTTDSNGDYTFDNVPAGDYFVVEEDPSGLSSVKDEDSTDGSDDVANADTNDNSIPVSVTPGETDSGNDFVDTLPAKITGNVSEDTNNDDNGDSPLSGVTVILVDANGDVVNDTDGNPLTTTTDINGDYTFDNVPAGDYFVVEEDPTDLVSVKDGDTTDGGDDTANTDTNDNSIPVSVEPGETDSGNDFVDEKTASISGNVSEDTTGNGEGDSPLSGVTVTLVDANGDVVNDTDGNPLTTTTDSNGDYTFDNVPAGDYFIVEEDPSGLSSVKDEDSTDGSDDTANTDTNDNSIPVSVEAGETDSGNDFVDAQPAKITGNVSEDTTGDGNGDTDLSGVVIKLVDANGNVVNDTNGDPLITATDSNGDYTFDNVPAGDYFVEEEDPLGLSSVKDEDSTDGSDDTANADTNDNSIPVSVVLGETDSGNDFVDAQPASITGNVSEDTTGDDNGDSPLSGVTVTLVDSNGDVVEDTNGNPLTTTTDSNGDYTFDNVPAGDYFVVEEDPTGLVSVKDGDTTDGGDDTANTDTNDNSIPVSVIPGETDSGNDFVDENNASISGNVSEDTTGDGNGDTNLVGVIIKLVDTNGNLVLDTNGNPLITTTDSNGNYEFTNVPVGDYFVEEIDPSGLASVKDEDSTDGGDDAANTDTNDNRIPVSVVLGETDSGNDFVDAKPATITGNVSEDTTGDDNGDSPLSGVTVTLVDSNGDIVNDTNGYPLTTTTDSDGNYEFTNVPAGDYFVEEEDPSGLSSVKDEDSTDGSDDAANADTNDNNIPVSVTPGETDSGNDFVDVQPATISGKVSEDTNQDGNGDSPLEGVTVILVDANGDVVNDTNGDPLTTTTDSNGDYTFDNVPAGDYFVVEEDPNGYISVKDEDRSNGSDDAANTDTNDNSIPVSVIPGEADSGNDFVDVKNLGSISGYVFKDLTGDEIGEEVIEGVTLVLTDANGATMTATTDTDGFYEFNNLPEGFYTIVEEQPEAYESVIDLDNDESDVLDTDGIINYNTTDDVLVVLLAEGEDDIRNDFVERPLGTISGYVSYTFDLINIELNPLEFITVKLYDANGRELESTMTDADGFYKFVNLPAGDYTVVEVQPTEVPINNKVYEFDSYSDYDESPENNTEDVNREVDNMIDVTLTIAEDDNDNNFVELAREKAALPVEFVSVSAVAEGNDAIVEWSTALEINNDRFEVERSTDGESFIKVGVVAGNGTTNNLNEYSFVDLGGLATGTVYYRIKQVDTNGEYAYSNIVTVETTNAEINVYPTVTRDLISIDGISSSQYVVYGLNGSVVKTGTTNGQVNISSLNAGMYLVKVLDDNGVEIHSEKIIKK